MIANSGPLPFLDSTKWYNHRRSYAYGQVSPLVAPIGRIMPFQFSRALGETGINDFTLVRYETGTEYDVSTKMTATGLSTTTIPTVGSEVGYVHTVYPGSVGIPIADLSEGLYYLRFQDTAGNWILSELFVWMNGLETRKDYLKVEWWHSEDIVYSGGRIKYTYPYKNWVWLQTDIGKPDYPVTEKVVNRDGVDFALQTISYKVHKFQFLSTEYLLDSMSLIRGHDHKEVTHMGKVIGAGDFDKIFSFLLTPEWLEQGDIASVEVEFRSNKVVIVNGRDYSELIYEEGDAACVDPTDYYPAVAWIESGSAQHTGKYWTDEDAVDTPFVSGDYIVITTGGLPSLKQFLNGNYIDVLHIDYNVVHTLNVSLPGDIERRNEYFYMYVTLYQEPAILSTSVVGSAITLTGRTFKNSLIEVWLRPTAGDYVVGTYNWSDFTGAGVTFESSGSNGYKVVARTYACENMGETAWVGTEGIDWWIIEDTFIVQPDSPAPGPDDPE